LGRIRLGEDKMPEQTKVLKGRFYAPYRVWKIKLPYSSGLYLYAGTKNDAEKYMRYLKKKFKNPYQCSVKEVQL
jgi:hypothetical protein